MSWEQDIKLITANQFNLLKKTAKRTDTLKDIKGTDLIYMPYGFVKEELPDLLSEGDFKNIFMRLFKKLNVTKLNVQEAVSALLWVIDSLEKIVKVEQDYLVSHPDPDLMNAGINRLNELGELNVLDAVAQRFRYRIEEVRAMPYYEVFNFQRKMKLENDIQKDLVRIQRDKSKQKKY